MTDKAKKRSALVRDGLKYAVIVVLGLCVDLGIALVVRWLFEIPLTLAGAIGFMTGVAFNYVLFEIWLFGNRRPGLARLGKAYLAALGAFIARVTATWGLGLLLVGVPYADVLTLVAAAGLSFVLNFLAVKFLLGRQGVNAATQGDAISRPAPPAPSPTPAPPPGPPA